MYQDISILISRTFIIIWCSLGHYTHQINLLEAPPEKVAPTKSSLIWNSF